MPMYEYRCRDCSERFEELRGINDSDDGIECPRCGGRVEKLFSAFATSGESASRASSRSSCGSRRGFS